MSYKTLTIGKPCKLELCAGRLVVRELSVQHFELSSLAVLVLENTNISITAKLLIALNEANIKVIFCDEKHLPYASFMPFRPSFKTSLCLEEQIAFKKECKDAVWALIVRAKIAKQAALLRAYAYETEAKMLEGYKGEVKAGDKTNREGHAAKVYFNALFGKDFSRDKECNVNAALNYGYAILLASFSREIAIQGFDARLGIFHKNQFNPLNLASDLMESFRPLVDKIVLSLHAQGLLSVFDRSIRNKLLDINNKRVYIAGKNHFVLAAIRIYTKSVLDALKSGELSITDYYYEF